MLMALNRKHVCTEFNFLLLNWNGGQPARYQKKIIDKNLIQKGFLEFVTVKQTKLDHFMVVV